MIPENTEEQQINPLVAYINECFNRAKQAKADVEQRMIRNLYTFRCQYTPDKLREIREIGGSEIFLPLANIKSRALKAWLTDIFFSNGEPPFDIEPTPVPELPTDLEREVLENLKSEVKDIILKARQVYELSGGKFDLSSLFLSLKEAVADAKRHMRERIREYAKELAEKEKRRIDDQFVEGGFYDALDDCLFDIAIFPCAIMKSCVPRKVKRFDKTRNVIEAIIPTFNRVSPFDIYPSPSVPDFSDWVIEVLHLTPQDLLNLKDVEGYNEEAINTVVGLYGDIGFSIEEYNRSERFNLEGKKVEYYNLIDVIEFWGSLPGELLLQADVEFSGDVEIEEGKYYDVAIWVCDNYILRATLNPDPLGMKPYHKASFIEIPDSFWGLSLIDVLYDLQMGVNALSRAIINNSALSSGPMIERNIDRVPPDEDKAIIPWKIFDSTSVGVSTEPAYRFYQPRLTANALVQVIAYFMKLADELSGVPAYAHGDVTVGGAGRTSSGLAMLMNQANRGIKEVVKNIDRGLIEPTVKRIYYYNVINYYGYDEEIPDLNIKAKGSTVLMEKLAQTQKLLELLNLTNNPVDMQLIGIEGRRYLLEHVFKNFGVSIPMPDELQVMVESLQQQLAQQASAVQKPKPKKEMGEVTEMAQEHRKSVMEEAG